MSSILLAFSFYEIINSFLIALIEFERWINHGFSFIVQTVKAGSGLFSRVAIVTQNRARPDALWSDQGQQRLLLSLRRSFAFWLSS